MDSSFVFMLICKESDSTGLLCTHELSHLYAKKVKIFGREIIRVRIVEELGSRTVKSN